MDEAKAFETGVRYTDGKVVSVLPGHPDIDVAGGSKLDTRPDAWSPVHLLVAASESCFFLTLLAVAEKMRIEIKDYGSSAEGLLTSADGKHKEISEVIIRPKIAFKNEADHAKIPQLFKITSEYCHVTRSLKAKIRVEMT